MKILRMTGMALVVILMSVHFVACNDDNDDDDPIGEIELLEGEWGLIYEGDFDSNGCKWEATFNPDNPEEDGEGLKLKIRVNGDKVFVQDSDYYDGCWEPWSESFSGTIIGNQIIKNNGYKLTITELTSDRLIIEIAGSNEGGDWSVAKYKRMN